MLFNNITVVINKFLSFLSPDPSKEQAGAQLVSPTTPEKDLSPQPADPAAAPLDGSTGPRQVHERRPTSTEETQRVTHNTDQASLDKERQPASATPDNENLQVCVSVYTHRMRLCHHRPHK